MNFFFFFFVLSFFRSFLFFFVQNYSPDLFEEEVGRILRDGIELVNIPEPLLGHRDLQTYVTAAASGGSEGGAGDSNGGGGGGGGPSSIDHGDGGNENEENNNNNNNNKSERDVVTLVYQATTFTSLHDGIFHGLKGWFDEVVEYTEVFAP